MNAPRLRLVAAGLALAVSAAAQTAADAFDAKKPHVRVTTMGPHGWRVRLGPTNVGSLLDSELAASVWRPYADALAESTNGLFATRAAFDAARERVLGYEGAVHLPLWLADDAPRDGVRAFALVCEPDGRTDMAAMAADLRVAFDRLGGGWEAATLAGADVDIQRGPSGAFAVAPLLRNGCLVFVGGQRGDLDGVLADALTTAAQASGKKPSPKQPPLVVDADAQALLARVFDLDPGDTWSQAVGLACAQRAQLLLSNAGPHVMLETALRFGAQPEGLMAALTPARARPPALLRALAAGAPSWRLGHFDFGAMWRTVLAVAAANDATTVDAARDEITKDLGVDLGARLFDLLGDEVLVVTQPVDDPDRIARATWAVAVSAKDGPALALGVAAVLDAGKPHITRQETATIAGVACSRYGNVLGYPVWIGVGKRALYLAGGSDAQGELAALIAAAEAEPAADAPAPEAAILSRFDGVQRALPPGLSGASRYDLAHGGLLASAIADGFALSLFSVPFGAMRDVDDDADAEARAEAQDRWLTLLREHQLAAVRTATGFADATWRFRVYW
jgi:hypothetical protein